MSKTLKRLVTVILAMVMVAALFTGCGSKTEQKPADKPADKPAETQAQKPAEKKDPVTIKHWVWLDAPNDPTFPNMVKEFNDTHPDIKVEMELVPWADFRTKLLTAATGGGLPDTASFKLSWIPEFVANDSLEPLDQYIDKWQGKSDIQENMWDVMKVADDKKTYVMPWVVQVLYMYYRPSLFKEAGITKVPETWDEWLEDAKKLTIDKDKDGKIDQYGFGMRGARVGHEPWGSFVFASVEGNKIMENGKPVFNTPEAQKANEMFLDLYKKYKVVPPTAPADGFAEIIANFKSGKTAMVVHHVMSSPDMMKTFGDDVSAFAVPAGPKGRWTSLGDTENAVFKSSKNKEAAFTWVSWLAEQKQIDKWCRASGNVPISKTVQKMDYYSQNRFMKASFDSMPYAHIYPVTEAMGEWTEQIWPATTQQALQGKITGEQMMKTLEEGMTKK